MITARLVTILSFFCVSTALQGALLLPRLQEDLNQKLLGADVPLAEVQAFAESRVPGMPERLSQRRWEKQSARLREDALDKVVFRGGAARGWRDARGGVEWLDTIPGGPGYEIRKLRYEALPGMWIPALLYQPTRLIGRVPVVLNVNGHDRTNGKAADYKQMRCINQAKRGMLALNVEWLGMGQLNSEGFNHYRMNMLDLCGASGLAPYYLAMSRALDLLLEHPNADPERVAVAGLSGGGWQTIFISALDTRVTLCNPVAGYSSFRTRARHLSDLGDSEQTPNDLATVLDYTHLTAMLAPRPALLTFNVKDQCCFAADHALPPLLDAAAPVYQLFGKDRHLRYHINHDPGTHNYLIDNRQALYRMLGDFFYPGDADYPGEEIESSGELKPYEALQVPLPKDNLDFRSIALSLMKALPSGKPSTGRRARRQLRELVAFADLKLEAQLVSSREADGLATRQWTFQTGEWTIPAVEWVPENAEGTTLLISDMGRAQVASIAESLIRKGQRVVAFDPFYFGESRISKRDYLFALLVAAVGERPLGIQAGQVAALAGWAAKTGEGKDVSVVSVGPRTSTIALVAAALEPRTIAALELHQPLTSLKDLIRDNGSVQKTPELFCFGLLESFDIPRLLDLVDPRPVKILDP